MLEYVSASVCVCARAWMSERLTLRPGSQRIGLVQSGLLLRPRCSHRRLVNDLLLEPGAPLLLQLLLDLVNLLC